MSAVAEEKQIIKGGAFLIEDRTPEEIFTPEDFTEEQRMIAQTTRELPVIAVSGNAHGLELARKNPDFFAALQKPFDPVDLIETTRMALRGRHIQH